MIFVRKNKILFLKPRKVAGASFEIALSKYAHADDIITRIAPEDEAFRRDLGFLGRQNDRGTYYVFGSKYIPRLIFRRKRKLLFKQHMSAWDARKRLGSDLFDSSFKISIVRNP